MDCCACSDSAQQRRRRIKEISPPNHTNSGKCTQNFFPSHSPTTKPSKSDARSRPIAHTNNINETSNNTRSSEPSQMPNNNATVATTIKSNLKATPAPIRTAGSLSPDATDNRMVSTPPTSVSSPSKVSFPVTVHLPRPTSISPVDSSVNEENSANLSYITDRILVVSVPVDQSAVDSYEISIVNISERLKKRYADNYKIFNLTKKCDLLSASNKSVMDFFWSEEVAPSLESIYTCCRDMEIWLSSSKSRVIVLVSGGGLSSLATCIAAYMYFCRSNAVNDELALLEHMALKRFHDDQLNTVSPPSHNRYVQYFSNLINGSLELKQDSEVHLHALILYGPGGNQVSKSGPGPVKLYMKIYQNLTLLHTTSLYCIDGANSLPKLIFLLDPALNLNGDIFIKCCSISSGNAKPHIVFVLQFHTCCVMDEALSFYKQDLDHACSDYRFSASGRVELRFILNVELNREFKNHLTDGKVSIESHPDGSLYRSNSFLKLNHPTVSKSHVNELLTGEYIDRSKMSQRSHLYLNDQRISSPYKNVQTVYSQNSQPPSQTNQQHTQYYRTDTHSPHARPANKQQPSPTASPANRNGPTRGNSRLRNVSGMSSGQRGMNADQGVKYIPIEVTSAQSSPSRQQHSGHHQQGAISKEEESKLDSLLKELSSFGDTKGNSLNKPRGKLRHHHSLDSATEPVKPHQDGDPKSLSQNEDDIPQLHLPQNAPLNYHLPDRPRSQMSGSLRDDLGGKRELLGYESDSNEGRNVSSLRGSSWLSQQKRRLQMTRDYLSEKEKKLIDDLKTFSSQHKRHFVSYNSRGGTRSATNTPPVGDLSFEEILSQRDQQQQLTQDMSQPRVASAMQRSRHLSGSEMNNDSTGYRGYSNTSRLVRGGSLNYGHGDLSRETNERDVKKRPDVSPAGPHSKSTYISTAYQYVNGTPNNTNTNSIRNRGAYEDSAKFEAQRELLQGVDHHDTKLNELEISLQQALDRISQQSQQRSATSLLTSNPHDQLFPQVPSLQHRQHDNSTLNHGSAPNTGPNWNFATGQLKSASIGAGFDAIDNSEHYFYGNPIVNNNNLDPLMVNRLQNTFHNPQIKGGTVSETQAAMSMRLTNQQQQMNSLYRSNTNQYRPTTPQMGVNQLKQLQPQRPQSAAAQTFQRAAISLPVSRDLPNNYSSNPNGTVFNGVDLLTHKLDSPGTLGATANPLRSPLSPGLHSSTVTTNQGAAAVPSSILRGSNNLHTGGSSNSAERFSGDSGSGGPISENNSTPKFVRETSNLWYKPGITREEAIEYLRNKPPGSFLVRDSNSFANCFGLAIKISQLPDGVLPKHGDIESELIRHFLIEMTSKGVRIRGAATEPYFGSLASLIYQHTLTPLTLPCRLQLPEEVFFNDNNSVRAGSNSSSNSGDGTACKVLYLGSIDVESLTGHTGISRAVEILLKNRNDVKQTEVQFKAAQDGVMLTDNWRKLFFRRHYPINTISHCALDPKDRRWESPETRSRGIDKAKMFGFIARKGSQQENTCHLFAESDPNERVTAILDYINRYLMNKTTKLT